MYYKSGRNKGLVSDSDVHRAVTARMAKWFRNATAPDAAAHDLGYVRTPDGRKRLIARHATDLVAVCNSAPATVVLIERLHPPGKGLYAIPGGFIGVGEGPADAAFREIEEETGLISGVCGRTDRKAADLRARLRPLGPWRVARAFDIRGTAWLRDPLPLGDGLALTPGDLMAVTTQAFVLPLEGLEVEMIRPGSDAGSTAIFQIDAVRRPMLGIRDHFEILQSARTGLG